MPDHRSLHDILLPQFDSTTRLYELNFRNEIPDLGSGGLLVEAFAASEELHGVGWRDIIVLSTNAHIELKTLIAQPATLQVSLADGSRTTFSGLVNQAALLGSDGGFARYRLRLVPWIWCLSQCSTSCVQQDATVIEVVETVFARHAPHAAWTWSDEAGPFLQDARRRGYCNQYRETDLDFVARVLAEEGIGWRIEEHADSPAGHRLVLFADSTQTCAVPEDATSAGMLGGAGIRYHGARTMEAQDSVCALGSTQVFYPASVTVAGYHHEHKRVVAASVPTRHAVGGARAPWLEAADYAGVDSFASSAEAERYARLHMEAIEARRECWHGRSTVRTLRPGTRFVLTQSALPGVDSADPYFTVTRVVSVGINNLPKPARDSVAELFGPLPELLQTCMDEVHPPRPAHDPWTDDSRHAARVDDDQDLFPLAAVIEQAQALGYANRFDAIDAAIPWRPLLADGSGAFLNAKPRALGSQTAIVVGADGSATPNGADEIYCDRQGRIRIRFHWQGRHDDAAATCWVRVAQRWAGGGFGAQFLPRIGQEVLVRFLDNDIDRPVVVAALYNGQGEGGVIPTPGGARDRQANITVFEPAHDHAASAQGNLAAGHSPVWHGASAGVDGHRNPAAQWGIRSKEFGGFGINQLVFDDTDQQGRIQLKTTQSGTQLELGHLIHTADNYRGSLRGQGFELRSDAYGAVRAGNGLLFSTYGIPHNAQTRAPVGDNAAGIAHLKQATQLADSFSQAATIHRTVALASHAGSTKAGASHIDDQAAPLKALLKAASGMVADSSIDAAAEDAANKHTAPDAGKVPHSTDPILAIAARAGIAMAAGQNMQTAVGETANLMNGADSQFISGGAMRVHTGQAIGLLSGAVAPGENKLGMQMIAAQDDIDIQAQDGTADIQARDLIDIVSAHSHIDWAAAKSISLSTEGGANITIAGGNITVQCPGKILIQAGKKSLVGPASASYALPVLPVAAIEPVAEMKLESSFAFDQLTRFARNCTLGEFIALIVPIFGYDIPAHTYRKLYEGLRAGSIANAEIVLMSGGHFPAAFDNKSREIRVHRAAAERAAKNNDEAWELLTALLHEFGHYIDAVLRQDLADKNPDGSSTLTKDAPGDEGARFAYEIAAFDLADSFKTAFANLTSPDYTGPLHVNYNEARKAIRKAQDAEAQRKEGKAGTLEYFGAGRGEHAKEQPTLSFGHESIEDALIESSGFFRNTKIRKQIYFGNWLRDFSQIVDPKIVRPPGVPKDMTRYFSRDALTAIVALRARIEFESEPKDKNLFVVTRNNLGVYRAVEHIDNPTNNDPNATDPRGIDPDFDPLPTLASLGVDPGTSMKRYIHASRDYMRSEMEKAMAAGPTPEGYRHFGAGLHVLEDYFAHSNFVELSLRKLGYANVLPWTSSVPGKHPLPLVTGMFDSEDVIASTAGMIADTFFKVQFQFEPPTPGHRTDFDKLMLILLGEHNDDTYLKSYQHYLWLRDQWASVPGHQYVDGFLHYTVGMVANASNFAINSLLHLMGNSVDDSQVHLRGDPNTNGSTDPSHSQLAKDHDNHPFHALAALLAKYAVTTVGRAMAQKWDGKNAADPASVAASFIVHPMDCNWQDQLVANWAKKHPAEIKRGESASEWIALRREHEKEVRETIDGMAKRSSETWEYINRNYEVIFGEKNQVKK